VCFEQTTGLEWFFYSIIPPKPSGSKFRESRTLSIGGTLKLLFLLGLNCRQNKLSFEALNIEIGPKLNLPDPKNPQNPSKMAWGVMG
jgi:hypothetical protein